MRPMREPDERQRELFQVELEQIIDLDHPLVRLGMRIDWGRSSRRWERRIIPRRARRASRRG
jgi:hypothetical protein